MNISTDSRSLLPGDIYIPIKGPHFDGHDFIEEAIKKGAAQVLDVEITSFARDHRLKHNIPIIAVTGSSGKTSTKDLLHSVLSIKYNVIKTKENQNNELGVPLTLLAIDDTTEIAIVEMGMRGLGEIAHLASIALPSHTIITNVGYTHLERLGSRHNIARAKAEIFTQTQDSPKEKYAFYPENIACRKTIMATAKKNHFTINEIKVDDFTQSNVDIVITVAKHFGLSDLDIEQGIANYLPSANRQEKTSVCGINLINDAYNANPESMIYALELLSRSPGRKIAVLGDMLELGEKAIRFHSDLAKYIKKAKVAKLFTLGQLSANINPDLETSHCINKKDLISELQAQLREGDTVLFKASRGIKLEEVFNAIKDQIQ